MAPDDNAPNPKAPDKIEKNKCEKTVLLDNPKDRDKDEKTLSNLNDGELKALLDEAITYKNPKDREGKSKLFKDLLMKAEETERIARAASAGGSELVRHCNPSAMRRRRGFGGRHQRAQEAARERRASAAEHPMHGGSLDNLAKEELYARCSAQHLTNRGGGGGTGTARRSVSARQREGGSLPCDVNSSLMPARDYQFLEEARKSKAMKNKDFTSIDMDAMESQSLLDHDVLQQNFQETQETSVPRYTTKATLQIAATPVDDPIPMDIENVGEKKSFDCETKCPPSKYNIYIHDKKFDENGNTVQQNQKIKKKKSQTDKKVVVLNAELVEGHRSDIINDVDKLTEFISGEKDKEVGKNKSSIHKSKHLHKQNASEDGTKNKKQRTHSSKSKETTRSELKKSNSLGEISTSTLEDFAFTTVTDTDETKVVLRLTKERIDRPKERRSWGNVEPPSFEILSSNGSTENLEQAENWVVTKPKKKSKKRRNSISSSSTGGCGSGTRRLNSTISESNDLATRRSVNNNRAPSPEPRGAKSVPYSEKSNDSSDADSVHSLPIDGLNTAAPISYADIAKNNEKSKEKKSAAEKPEQRSLLQAPKEKTPFVHHNNNKVENESKIHLGGGQSSAINQKISSLEMHNPKSNLSNEVNKNHVVVDVSNPKDFPSIQSEQPNTNKPLQPPDVTNPKTFPAMPTEIKASFSSSPPEVKSLKNASTISTDVPKSTTATATSTTTTNLDLQQKQTTSSSVVAPLDVTSPKSFPGLPNEQSPRPSLVREFCSAWDNNNNSGNVSKVAPHPSTVTATVAASTVITVADKSNNVRNNNIIICDKVARKISLGDNNNKCAVNNNNNNSSNNNNNVKVGSEVGSGYLRVNVKVSACVLQNNIQNDLSIIHSNEKDSIQFNAQMMPPNIPDVQTIEKMHFMNRPSPPAVPPTIPQHPAVATAEKINISSTSSSNLVVPVPIIAAPPLTAEHDHVPRPPSAHRMSDCDSSERTISGDFDVATVDNEDGATWEDERPPVIILSGGGGNKEVPGLVFGFDINEQLLSEDICDSFVARYVAPESYSNHSHNHDKIVNFIGSAWEAIINQSNGKIQFFNGES